MRVSMIVAAGRRWQIGLNNNLLWHIPEDLKHFKNLTTNHHIIMGRKTFESIGKALPNRTSIVLSKSGFKADNVFTCKDIDEALNLAKENGEDEVFIIGGAKVYNATLPLVDRLYLSIVDYDGRADTFFPQVVLRDWQLLDEKTYPQSVNKDGEKIPAWQYFILQRMPKA
ncbi:MAG: dihydrofolate reductase [Campylobacteraceae bacterium]